MKKEQVYGISLGAFAPCADRFVTGGYHKEMKIEKMLELAASVKGSDVIEMDYPFPEPISENVQKMKNILDSTGAKVCTLEIDHYSDPKWKNGALVSSEKDIRRQAIEVSKRGMDAAIELGASQINLWLGHDGYDYPMQANYLDYWDRVIEKIREIAEYRDDVKVCIEYKPKEPRTHSLIATVGKALLVANAVELENVGVNIDTGHALMAGENLADSAILANRFNRLFYLHFNDNYRAWDDDMIVSSVHLWETLELLYWLNKINYRGFYVLDIYPYREDPVQACVESIENLKHLGTIVEKLDKTELSHLQEVNDMPSIIHLLRKEVLK